MTTDANVVRARPLWLLSIVALVLFAAAIPGTVAATEHGPEPVDSCANAPTLEPGTYSTTVTPEDGVIFTVDGMSQGNYVTFNAEYDRRDIDQLLIGGATYTNERVEHYADFEETVYAGSDMLSARAVDWELGEYDALAASSEGSGQLWLEADTLPCIAIWSEDTGAGAVTFSFDVNSAEPPAIPDPDRVTELESKLQSRDERIDTLESRLENKNETIRQQGSRIGALEERLDARNETVDELRAELEATGSSEEDGGDSVNISVAVSPSDGQQNFVEGTTAQVEVRSTDVDPDEVSVEYGSATYDVDESGHVEVALAGAGTHEMGFVYGDSRETVSIEVQDSSDADALQSRSARGDGDNSTTAVDGPGLGVLTGLAAVTLYSLVRRRS